MIRIHLVRGEDGKPKSLDLGTDNPLVKDLEYIATQCKERCVSVDFYYFCTVEVEDECDYHHTADYTLNIHDILNEEKGAYPSGLMPKDVYGLSNLGVDLS